MSSVEIEKDVACIGGVAKNIGMIEAIKNLAQVDILVPEEPEIVVALGAALVAMKKGGTLQ